MACGSIKRSNNSKRSQNEISYRNIWKLYVPFAPISCVRGNCMISGLSISNSETSGFHKNGSFSISPGEGCLDRALIVLYAVVPMAIAPSPRIAIPEMP
jgi:hypothetical protein